MHGPNEAPRLRDFLAGFNDDLLLWITAGAELTAGDLKRALLAHADTFAALAGCSVAVTGGGASQFAALLLALDGHCRALLLLPADLPADRMAEFMRRAGAEILMTAPADASADLFAAAWQPSALDRAPQTTEAGPTRWIIPTSGTTGEPKLVSHTLATLTRTVRPAGDAPRPRWGLLYDLARFAGLQVFFQSFLTGSPLIFTDSAGALPAQIAALAAGRCTALSATPTLWRKILMSGTAAALPLQQITLGGEIADAAILAALARAYPGARITTIYASTEAGVGFSVRDGREGFPTDYLTRPPRGIEIAVDADGFLLLRPATGGQRFVDGAAALSDDRGWINTGDLVRRAGDRYLFLGRANGAINVGGNKVFPEEVERVICQVDGVALALVRPRRSAITGALVEAVVVPAAGVTDRKALARAVQAHCRAQLPAFKAPAIVTVSDALETAATGKIVRGEP